MIVPLAPYVVLFCTVIMLSANMVWIFERGHRREF